MTVRAVVSDTVFLVGKLETPGPLEAFRGLDALDVGTDNDTKWSAALRNFDVRMERYENTIVENLKTKFHDSDSGSLQVNHKEMIERLFWTFKFVSMVWLVFLRKLQMLMEFRKCRSVIGRPKVKRALTAER